MTDPDYKIKEFFDFDEMKVYYYVLKLSPTGDYFLKKKCDDLITAKDCVRMARKYKNPIYHYVED